MEKTARTKLSERNMHWEETYTERTISFKEMYKDIIGEGSYYRWEGKDVDSGDEYFVVLSPANMKKPKARWFTGCRKLPSDWAAGGKYFSEIKDAMDYAHETWGVPVPSDFQWGYDSSDLKGIADKMDDWRESATIEAKVNNKMNRVSKLCDFSVCIYKESGAKEWTNREGYVWFSADQLEMGDKNFEKMAQNNPKLLVARENIQDERKYRQSQIKHRYGEQYANADFYQSFLGVGQEGIFIVAVSPYLGKKYEKYGEAKDKLGVFRKKLNILNKNEIATNTNNFIVQYMHDWGVQLLPEDISVKGMEVSECTWALSKSGIKKAKAGKIYQDNLNYYKQKYGAKNQKEANKYYNTEVQEYQAKKVAFDKAYKEAQKSGKSMEFNIPPPPTLNFKKPLKRGSQYYTAIFKEEEKIPKGISEEQKILTYGFNSFQEALSYTTSTMSSDFPAKQISAINVTSDELKAFRLKNEATKTPQQKLKEKMEEKEMEDNIKQKQEKLLTEIHDESETDVKEEESEADEKEAYEETITMLPETETKPEKPPEVEIPEIKIPKAKAPKAKTPEIEVPEIETPPIAILPKKDLATPPKKTIEDYQKEYLERKKKKAVTQAILNLVKLAETLDSENKPEDAEEIHKILRKHTGN